MELIGQTKTLLEREPNMVKVDGAVAMIGDIHGQLYDMFHMMDLLEKPARGIEKLVFLGDYVDRGMYGPEVMMYVMALKVAKPHDVILLRGNHESRAITTEFNFRSQCVQWFDEEVYDSFMDLFDHLPLAAIINGEIITLHGGITRGLEDLNHIN